MNAVIYGGTKGIGRSIALSLADSAPAGSKFFINYAHDDAAAADTREALLARGVAPILCKGDIGNSDGAFDVARRIASETDVVHQVVHASVKAMTATALAITPAEFHEALQLNGVSLLYTVQSLRPLLVDGSSIVFLSSQGSKVAIRNYMPLGAPKALAEALVRYLAVELARDRIRINIVTPAALPTEALQKIVPDVDKVLQAQAKMTPMGRNVTFDDVNRAVQFLHSSAAGFITAQELVIDGGLYTRA